MTKWKMLQQGSSMADQNSTQYLETITTEHSILYV